MVPLLVHSALGDVIEQRCRRATATPGWQWHETVVSCYVVFELVSPYRSLHGTAPCHVR